MIDWYTLFLGGIVLLWLMATNRDRPAALIVMLATWCSLLLVDHVTVHIAGAWKLFIPGAVETTTICCLLTWARNRTGYWQAGCLTIAWLAHLLCYVDVQTGTDLVYTHYEQIIEDVAVAQLAGFYETLSHVFRSVVAWGVAAGRLLRGGAVRAAGLVHPLLRAARLPKL